MQDLLDRGALLSKRKREIERELREIRSELACTDCIGQYECENGSVCIIKPLEATPDLNTVDHGRLQAIIGADRYDDIVKTCHTIRWSEYKNAPSFVKQAITSLSSQMRGGGVSVSFKS